MWRKNFLWNYIYKELITYLVYANLFYWWNFGVLSFVCLAIQVLTGIFLAMYYNATSETAFLSVEHIRWNTKYGWVMFTPTVLCFSSCAFIYTCSVTCIIIHILETPKVISGDQLWIILIILLSAFIFKVLIQIKKQRDLNFSYI